MLSYIKHFLCRISKSLIISKTECWHLWMLVYWVGVFYRFYCVHIGPCMCSHSRFPLSLLQNKHFIESKSVLKIYIRVSDLNANFMKYISVGIARRFQGWYLLSVGSILRTGIEGHLLYFSKMRYRRHRHSGPSWSIGILNNTVLLDNRSSQQWYNGKILRIVGANYQYRTTFVLFQLPV